MIIGHVMARREARRQRKAQKAQWMIGRCYPQHYRTDIMIEEQIIEPVIEVVQEVVMKQSVLEKKFIEPVTVQEGV